MKHTHNPEKARDARPDRGALARKDFSVEVKSLDESGAFEIYAAVFGNVDRQGDIIVPGAFRNLPEFVLSGWIAVNHMNHSLPVAFVDSAVQDAKGLKIRGRFHSTPEAQSCRTVVRERMAAGKSVKCSIGYRTVDAATEVRDGEVVTLLKGIEVFEASFVNLPANPAAGATDVKSVDKPRRPSRLKEIGAIIDGLKVGLVGDTKAGREIKRSNFAKLKEWSASLRSHGETACKMADEIDEFLAPHDPDKTTGDDAEPGDDAPAKSTSPEKQKTESPDGGLALKRRRLSLMAARLNFNPGVQH